MPLGQMVFWRFKKNTPGAWIFGYTSSVGGGLIRMGCYNGDITGGVIISPSEVEYKNYRN